MSQTRQMLTKQS